MTREEQINKAAFDYADTLEIGENRFDYEDIEFAFQSGAEWADENPKPGLIDLSQVWHNSKEEPEKGKSIISIGSTGVSAYKWVDEWRCDWVDFAEWSELFRWAYVDDLLPKGGEL